MHELKLSEVSEKFNVGNKNGTFQNFLVFPEHIDMHFANAIICNNLKAPLSNGNYSFWTPPITVVKTQITSSLFTVIRSCEGTRNK